ncbi:MAG: hemerythrin domain-containing protein [Bacteroidota bacterium]
MQRYNVFLMVHKGLRAMLYDVSLSLQHTDFAHAEDPHSLEKLAVALDIFDAHAGHEDKFIFSMLEPCAADLMNEMEAEHVTDHALSASLRSLIAAFPATQDPTEKYTIGTQICHAFNEFIAFNLTHLKKEETVVNEALWKNYTDMDILQANQKLVGSLPPDEARRSALWMIRSCSNGEITGWINAIKKNIPPPLFQMLMHLVESELPAERAELIQNRIMEVA